MGKRGPKPKPIQQKVLEAAAAGALAPLPRLGAGSKDDAGFVTDSQPALSEQQLLWLMHRLGTHSDEDACAATYAESDTPIDLLIIESWKADPVFAGVYEDAQHNKREAFRYLTGQMLPKAARVIWSLISNPQWKAQAEGVKLLLRTQGLLIDRAQTHNPEAIQDLLATLRERKPLNGAVITIEPRQLPSGGSGT